MNTGNSPFKKYDLNWQLLKKAERFHELELEDNFTGIFVDGFEVKYWYVNGRCHREDGAAIEWPDGYKEYFINNERLLSCPSEEAFKLYINLLKLKGLL